MTVAFDEPRDDGPSTGVETSVGADAVQFVTWPHPGDAVAVDHQGGVGDHPEQAAAREPPARETVRRRAPPADKARAAEPKAASRPAKLSFNEKRELEALPERIAALEDEQAALHARMADPTLYQSAPQEVAHIKTRLEAHNGEIEAAMLRWEELESRAAG